MDKQLILNGNRIDIHFPFEWKMVFVIRDLPDRRFDSERDIWYVPATAWHTAKAIAALKPHGFVASAEVLALEKQPQVEPKIEYDKRLYDFQVDGVKFLVSHKRAILADSMGLGKTPQALMFVGHHAAKTLVVAPANVLYKWLGEVSKWTNRTAQVVATGKTPLADVHIHIMSYDIMRIRYEELSKQLYDCAVFDEAHALKNYKAGRTRAAKNMLVSGAIRKVLFLSGTPFLNRPDELFSLLNMLNSGAYPNYFQYARRYCGAYFEQGHWVFPRGLTTNIDELANRLSHIMIRRTKREVLKSLPDKTRTIVPVTIPLGEYRAAMAEFKTWSKGHPSATSYNVLTQMTAMRRIVGEAKVEAAIELTKDLLEQDEKVVLYAHHLDVVDRLRSELRGYKIGIIQGSTKPKERQAITDWFQTDDAQVIIISSAGVEGIDLYSASHIIFVEREWTPAKEEQAEDRLHRIGQKNAVNCWYLTAQGTIDEKFAEIVNQKREVFGAVIGQDEILTKILKEIE